MLQCKDITKQTSDYIDGNLPLSKRIAMFVHLVICRCCQNYVQQIRITIDNVSRIQPQENDATDRQALVKKLQSLGQQNQSGDQ